MGGGRVFFGSDFFWGSGFFRGGFVFPGRERFRSGRVFSGAGGFGPLANIRRLRLPGAASGYSGGGTGGMGLSGFQLAKFAIARAWAEYPSASDGYGTSRMITKSDFSSAARRTRRHGLAPKFGSAPAGTNALRYGKSAQPRALPPPGTSRRKPRLRSDARDGRPRLATQNRPGPKGFGFPAGCTSLPQLGRLPPARFGNQPALFSAGIRESMA